MINTLITGGAGYIGSMLAEKLLTLGFKVTVVDKLTYGAMGINHLLMNDNFKFVHADVEDFDNYSEHLRTCDVFIPLAALVGAPLCAKYRKAAEKVNYSVIANSLDFLKDDCFVLYPNTNSGYGVTSGTELCTEEMELNPISLYGETKVRAEAVIKSWQHFTIFRLATVFGVSYRPRFDLIVNNFVKQAVLEKNVLVFQGEMKRNFVHVKDVVDAFAFAIEERKSLSGEVYNLGNDNENCTKLELAQKVAAALDGVNVIEGDGYIDPDKRNYVVSNQKLRDAGFVAERCIKREVPKLADQIRIMTLLNANY